MSPPQAKKWVFRSFLGGSLKTWTPPPGVGGYPLGLVELREYTQNLVESRVGNFPNAWDRRIGNWLYFGVLGGSVLIPRGISTDPPKTPKYSQLPMRRSQAFGKFPTLDSTKFCVYSLNSTNPRGYPPTPGGGVHVFNDPPKKDLKTHFFACGGLNWPLLLYLDHYKYYSCLKQQKYVISTNALPSDQQTQSFTVFSTIKNLNNSVKLAVLCNGVSYLISNSKLQTWIYS